MVEIRESQQPRSLDVVFGKVQLTAGRGGTELLYGWDTGGYPMATTDRRRVTQEGRRFSDEQAAVTFPFTAEQASFTPVASEFASFAKPIDRPDRGAQFTEDTVNIATTDEQGSVKFIKVKELTLLEAVINGQVVSGFGDHALYSVLIPDSETETLNIIIFSPGEEATNEFMYRTFLLNTIKVLAEIDRNQRPPDQKGYMHVVNGVLADAIRKGIGNQSNSKIMARLGILGEINDGQRLAYFNLEQLRYTIEQAYAKVTQSFAEGRQR